MNILSMLKKRSMLKKSLVKINKKLFSNPFTNLIDIKIVSNECKKDLLEWYQRFCDARSKLLRPFDMVTTRQIAYIGYIFFFLESKIPYVSSSNLPLFLKNAKVLKNDVQEFEEKVGGKK